MISKCANSHCSAMFVHRQGRLFRLPNVLSKMAARRTSTPCSIPGSARTAAKRICWSTTKDWESPSLPILNESPYPNYASLLRKHKSDIRLSL